MPKLHFIYSVMNAGKSTELLQTAHNYEANGGRVLCFTSSIDDRAGVGRISSRLGISREAYALSSSDNLYEIVRGEAARKDVPPLSAVLIDEVQFLDVQHIEQASDIVDILDIPVLAYGLKNNAFGNLFSPAIECLLALANDIREHKTVCHCGAKATMILRYGADGVAVKTGAVVQIGGESSYQSVCRKHWKAGDIGPVNRARLGLNLECLAAE